MVPADLIGSCRRSSLTLRASVRTTHTSPQRERGIPHSPNKKPPSRLARGFCVSLKPNVASIDVVRVLSQSAAVGAVTQGVEHVAVDAVLDVMHRAVREDRVHACRMRRAESKPRMPARILTERVTGRVRRASL